VFLLRIINWLVDFHRDFAPTRCVWFGSWHCGYCNNSDYSHCAGHLLLQEPRQKCKRGKVSACCYYHCDMPFMWQYYSNGSASPQCSCANGSGWPASTWICALVYCGSGSPLLQWGSDSQWSARCPTTTILWVRTLNGLFACVSHTKVIYLSAIKLVCAAFSKYVLKYASLHHLFTGKVHPSRQKLQMRNDKDMMWFSFNKTCVVFGVGWGGGWCMVLLWKRGILGVCKLVVMCHGERNDCQLQSVISV